MHNAYGTTVIIYKEGILIVAIMYSNNAVETERKQVAAAEDRTAYIIVFFFPAQKKVFSNHSKPVINISGSCCVCSSSVYYGF